MNATHMSTTSKAAPGRRGKKKKRERRVRPSFAPYPGGSPASRVLVRALPDQAGCTRSDSVFRRSPARLTIEPASVDGSSLPPASGSLFSFSRSPRMTTAIHIPAPPQPPPSPLSHETITMGVWQARGQHAARLPARARDTLRRHEMHKEKRFWKRRAEPARLRRKCRLCRRNSARAAPTFTFPREWTAPVPPDRGLFLSRRRRRLSRGGDRIARPRSARSGAALPRC